MPDMKDALGRAGFKSAEPRRTRAGPAPSSGAHPGQPVESSFPPGYPKYFAENGSIRVDMITIEAERLAARFEADRLKRHQLRSFFDHAKRQSQRLVYGAPFGEVHPQIALMKAFAADRAERADNKLPQSFKQFIDRNVDAINNEAAFRRGFMPHFEAVVAYCARIKD
ncbi:MAG TPA: type III-A CRISPR-associated protein Csm2 [Bryobacteraceae bacterium]|nr:type III-A CRISPR-associated protein Csm2 [Bryobacteraceae bacterium]